MGTKRTYKRINVKQIDLEQLRDRAIQHGNSGTSVGLDIGKGEVVVCVRWPNGEFERPWSVANTSQIGMLLERLELLKEVCGSLTVGMESTGTYGEAVRRAMTESGIVVHRVSGKATSDYQEIFDGVPSQHDGKDAAIVSELTAFGKGTAWPYVCDSESLQLVKHQFRRMDCYRTEQVRWLGRLEALLAKHWPELTKHLKLSSATLLKMLKKYQSPGSLVADPKAAKQLQAWGGSRLTEQKITLVLESARTTCGVPATLSESLWLGEVASKALEAYREVQSCQRNLKQLMAQDKTMVGYVSAVGAATLGALWSTVGDPRQYGSSGAYLKALGLNLKERSSGRRQGQLAITKRGPSKARRWVFYWSLRAIQREELSDWYRQFIRVGNATSGKREHRKMKGVVAMMRKLCRGLWYAMKHEEEFDYNKLLELKKPRAKRSRRRGKASASKLEI